MNEKPKLICCGIGDFIALTSFLPLPKRILLATSRAAGIGEMCRHMGVDIEILEEHWTYYCQAEVEARHGPLDVEDWNIGVMFPQILKGLFSYKGCPLFKKPLPRRISGPYTVICPASMNKLPGRDLTPEEVAAALKMSSGQVVVINRGDYKCEPNKRVLDLTNKTSLMEALAIVMHADGLIGVDSWEAVSFAQTLRPMIVKSGNPFFHQNKSIWLAPLHDKIQVVTWIY